MLAIIIFPPVIKGNINSPSLLKKVQLIYNTPESTWKLNCKF